MQGIAQNLRFAVHNSPLQAQDRDVPQIFGVYFQHNHLPLAQLVRISSVAFHVFCLVKDKDA
jgi:hypothetical protein